MKYAKRVIKKVGRVVKKRYFKGKGYTNPKLSTMARDINIMKSMVNAEKEIYTAHSASNVAFSPTSPIFVAIDNTTEGTGHGQRDGESIKLHGYRWNLRFSQQTSAQGPQFIKIYLVKYIGPRGGVPAISTFLKADFDGNFSYHSERNEDHYTSYNVIKTISTKIQADTVSGINMYNVKKVYGRFKGKTHQRYSGTLPTTLLTDQMYIIAVASNGTIGTSSAVTYDSQLLVSFYDN